MNPPPPPAGPFRPDAVADFSSLRAVLEKIGYHEAALQPVLEGRNEQTVDRAVALHRTEAPTPFNILARLFALHLTVLEEMLEEAIEPARVEELFAAGMIERDASGVRAVARLTAWRHLLLLNDFLSPEGMPPAPDFVMSGASPSSISLAVLTVRRKIARALDLGTGAGIHALLAAAHAERVVATDSNARAELHRDECALEWDR